jgi:hypothetical protein
MKKIFLVSILLAFALISLVSADTSSIVNYTTDSNQGIVVTQLKYSSYPANPGEYIDLWVQAQVVGTVTPSNATFMLNAQYPFSLDLSDSGVRSFGQLGSTPVVMHFKVRVDQNAVIGDNQLELDYSPSGFGSTNAWSVKMLDIQIANVQTSFDMVLQDSTSSEVSLAIANTGQNTANSMIVKIPEQKGFSITGTNGQMVGNLDSGDYTLVTFEVTKDVTETRNLTVEIDYTDSIGVRRQTFENVTFLSSSSTSDYALINRTGGTAIMGGNVAAGTNFSPGQFPGGTYRRGGNTTSWVVYVVIIAGVIVLLIIGSIIYRKNSKKIKEHFRKKKYQKDFQTKEKAEVNNSKSQQLPDWIRKVKESEKK